MKTPETTDLVEAWEHGAGRPPAARALLLLTAAFPDSDGSALSRLSIGERDRLLLNLRGALFGRDVRCLTDCPACGERIELGFRLDDVRASCGESGRAYKTAADSYDVQFRLPESADLLALEGEPPARAAERLLIQCVLSARTTDGAVDAATLPATVLSAIAEGMKEADPQADVLLDLSCPECGHVAPAPFDIVTHLWAELEAWVRRTLRDVHTLAAGYGWSEEAILRMSPVRRHVYLELLGS